MIHDSIRHDFPILKEMINGHPLTYLDNAATTQKPAIVIDALDNYYRTMNANIHRSVHTLGERATEGYENARKIVKEFINAQDTKEIIFVRGTTDAINLIAHSFVKPQLKADDIILVTTMEHHSNIVPWQLIAEEKGANVRAVNINEKGELNLDDLKQKIVNGVRFLAIAHVSNALGTINPIKEIIAFAHQHNVCVCVDGAQAVGHMAVDVQDLDADFYAFSSHKLYGPTGIGALYGKAKYLESMPPYQGGGEMIFTVSFEKTEYAGIPHKFEAGTPPIAAAIGMAAAIEYIKKIGLDNIAAHEHQLLVYAKGQLKSIPGLRFIGEAENKAAIISFVLQNAHPHDIGTILNAKGIAIRSGHHCAMPLMNFFGVAGTARASFAFYNTHEEIDRLVDALWSVNEVMGLERSK